ncbi:type II secretion system minor pseudopilin GspK [bacterium endosymbiont of Bathymodiolus sp. 5 South]|jgi:general secretion pathway protein K|uniref:type II secretion system minor pseudopilin GspK n=1 Tax=bacterium endosymbiont of Bathymodiolus sp. 5 South TaxID=1181670 RepID=UPI0010B69A78|nr:type II secretion system minor pseudopilin GspK [bacterium endosymbiont of Bathymodiolus sp. 5 South]CAC9436995.1 hypothetical protein [uncultured Gammaproteobacteria bacterium]CAC9637539.1 hypothetical protein [uncultured Gammaproteobacteria bacterium]CAC9642186.1 hypothetical protein [uncultured Gammaproteobacteria bacterium]CAC9659327.1 hypothetical protein [uncultured Gammaproteobacteria bacterium]SHN93240.1 hypothetical protein BCLUESOX_434 [bacterium endosymbiont of Bathymodiolus sp. 
MNIVHKKNEKGVVLVSVLIIVAMISLAVSLMWQQQAANLNSTKNIIHTSQAVSYLYSLEVWTKSILRDDDAQADYSEERWAVAIPPIKVPNGVLHGKIIDMQARLNINHLISINSNFTQAYLIPNYKNCLDRLNTNLDQDFMSDFIIEYVNKQRPIKKFKHLSDLRKVEGIEYKDYLKIKPYLTASSVINTVNINTVSKEVLSCLHPDLSISLAQDIIGKRPFNSLGEAQTAIHQAIGGLSMANIQKIFNANLISINSHFFLLESDIQIASSHIKVETLFHRENRLLSVISRTYEQILRPLYNPTKKPQIQ